MANAIEPFRQRVGIPEAAPPLSQGVRQIADLGSVIDQAGQKALSLAEPFLKDEALKRGVNDAAATSVGKDEQGNYVLAKAPTDGGLVYAAAFDRAALQRYTLHVNNDVELKQNQIYSDPANIGKTPTEMLALSTAALDGTLQNVAPEAYNDVFEAGTREVRQRNLAASNEYIRKQQALMQHDQSVNIEQSMSKGVDAASMGAVAEVARLRSSSIESMQTLIHLGMATPADMDRLNVQWGAVTGAGLFKSEWRNALPGLNADQNDQVADFLDGNVPAGTEVMGKTLEQAYAQIPDPSVRQHLAQDIRSVSDSMRRNEAIKNKADELDNNLSLVPVGGPFPALTSEEDKSKLVLGWAGNTGVNIFTPEGATQAFQRFGAQMPGGMYKDFFDHVNAKTPVEVEQAYSVYRTMKNMYGRNGQTVDIIEGKIDPKDSAFMYHYSNARAFGDGVQAAYNKATAAVAKGLEVKPEDVIHFLRERTGLNMVNGSDQLGNKIESYLGGPKWADLNLTARDAVELDMAQQVVLGMPWPTAAQNAGQRFHDKWQQDPISFQGAASGGKAYVPKTDAVPMIKDVATGNPSQDWAKNAISFALDTLLGPQAVPGLPARKDLKPGENVFAQFTGQVTAQGGKLFNVMYYDPKGSGMAQLLGKDGTPMLIDLGKQGAIEQNYVTHHDNAQDTALSAIGQAGHKVQGQTVLEQITSGAASVITGVPATGSAPTKQDADHMAALQRAYRERFAVSLNGGEAAPPPPADQQGLLEVRSGIAPAAEPGGQRGPIVARGTPGPTTLPRHAAVTSAGIAPPTADVAMTDYAKTANQWPDVARAVGSAFGISPRIVAAVFSYETGGTFDHTKLGGDTGKRLGFIQFGEDERVKYGNMANKQPITASSTPQQWAGAIIAYLKDRGFKAGGSILDLYSTINAGGPGRWNANDGNGTVAQHVNEIMTKGHFQNADRWLGNRR